MIVIEYSRRPNEARRTLPKVAPVDREQALGRRAKVFLDLVEVDGLLACALRRLEAMNIGRAGAGIQADRRKIAKLLAEMQDEAYRELDVAVTRKQSR